MRNRRTAGGRGFVAGGILVLLAGCASTPMGPTVQVMPGPGKSFDMFQADQAICKNYAEQQVQGQSGAANQRALATGAVTTLVGAGLGAAIGAATGSAGAGAAIGAATGLGGGALYGAHTSGGAQGGIQQQYDNAFAQCMYSKGDQVPGWAPLPPPSPAAMADPMVRATQSELVRLGYLHKTPDGIMGSKTRGAIVQFQQAKGLPADGVPSQRLLAALQATPTGAPPLAATALGGWAAPKTQ
jgi:hypothetical protein